MYTFDQYKSYIDKFDNVKMVKDFKEDRGSSKFSAKGHDFLFNMLLNLDPNKRPNIHEKIDYLGLPDVNKIFFKSLKNSGATRIGLN